MASACSVALCLPACGSPPPPREPPKATAAVEAETAFAGALAFAAESRGHEGTPAFAAAARRRIERLSLLIGEEARGARTSREVAEAIGRVIFGHENFRADPDDIEGSRPESFDIARVLETRRGACLPVAIVIARAASGAGVLAGVARAPGHAVAAIGPPPGVRRAGVPTVDFVYLDPAERGYWRTWADIIRARPWSPKADRIYDGRPLEAREVMAQLRANRAAHRLAEGRLGEAEADARAALEAVPDLPEALVNLAAVHLKRKRAGEAYEVLERARELLPRNAVVLYNLGLAAAARGDALEAIGHYEGALQADPRMEKARANKKALEEALARERKPR